MRAVRQLGRTGLYTTLVAWGTISAIRQFTREGPPLFQRMDPYGLYIPNYHFFCPEPAQHDLNLMYRDRFADGDLGPWQEIVTTQRRMLRHILFYPRRRLDKGMMDVANEVIKFARISGEAERISISRPYLSILNMVTYGVPHDPRVTQVQFAIGHSAAYEPGVEPTVTFVSNFHDLPAAAGHRAAVPA